MSNFSDDLNRLSSTGSHSDDPVRERVRVPKGWEATIDYDNSGGFFVSSPRKSSNSDTPPEEQELFDEFNLDPVRWEITNIRRSKWQSFNGEWLEAFRATFAPRSQYKYDISDKDIEDMHNRITKIKPTKRDRSQGNDAFVLVTGDTQFGKPDGDGTEGTIQRVYEKNLAAIETLKMHQKRMNIGEVYLPWLGDCIEGYNSQGGKLMWRNELTLTQMVRVYRRMLEWQITKFAPLVDKLVIPVIPGNHDEAVRVGNSMATTYDDSWAIEGAVAVQDMLKYNPEAFGHVEFIFPKPEELTMTVDIGGAIVGLAHGHQFGRDPFKWWANQSHGNTPVGHSEILLAGHLHHLHIQQTGTNKTFIQIPAMDGGSTWYKHRQGSDTPAGLLSFTISDGKWNNINIH